MKKGLLLTENVAGVNQLIDSAHPFAYDLWKKGCSNNWMPTEVNMTTDINQWNQPGFITDDEKHLVRRCLGFFASTESLVANNLLLSIFKYITDGSCRQYILRQAFEESLHNSTIEVCCSALNLDKKEVAAAYQNIPSIKAKDEFLMGITSDISRNDFSTATIEGKREFLRNLITFYIICEGTFFFSGFAMLLSLGRQNKLPGIADQIRFTLRDETLHIQFGIYVTDTIRRQYSDVWTPEFEKDTIDHIKQAAELEITYAKDVLPRGLLGLNADMFVDYMKYIANRRMEALNLPFRYDSDKNPFPWLSEQVDTGAMTNFFERRVRDYQQAGSLKDDF